MRSAIRRASTAAIGFLIAVAVTGLAQRATNAPAARPGAAADATARIAASAQALLTRLHYRNAHRPDIGVYLANALVPVSDRVAVTTQRRDVDQRDLIVEYLLHPAAATSTRRWMSTASLAGGSIVAFVVRRRRATQGLR